MNGWTFFPSFQGGPQKFGAGADFPGARQKDQKVAGGLTQHLQDGGGDPPRKGSFSVGRKVALFDRKGLTLRRDYRRSAQEGSHGAAVEGCRHDQDLQVFPQGAAEVEAEGQRQVRLEAALVKLVENNHGNAFQAGILLEAPGEDALGHHLEAGLFRSPAVEADGITQGPAEGFAKSLRHPPRRGNSREATRLQHDDPPFFRREYRKERQGGAGRLAGAGRRLKDHRRTGGYRLLKSREDGIDGIGFLFWDLFHN